MPSRRYYWDSDVFISVLSNEETRLAGELEGAREVAQLADLGEAIIYTALVSDAEVLSSREQFLDLFRSPFYVRLNVPNHAFSRAGTLRQACGLSMPDAMHVVMAMIAGVNEMHTFDKKLLALTGKAVVNNLRICHPAADQKLLGL